MAKLPLYEQQTTMGQVRASGQQFGSGVAQAVGQAGEVMQGIGDAMLKREESIRGITAFNDLNDQLRRDYEGVVSSGNIALGETVDGFKQAAMQRVEETLARTPGRSEFKAAFRNQLVNQVGQYVNQARSDQIKAQYKLAGQYVSELSGKLANDAVFSPEKLDDYMTLFNMGVDKFDGAFDKNVVSELRRSGQSALLETTIAGLQESGNWQAADQLIQREDFKPLLASEQGIRLTLNNLKLQRVSMKEDQERVQNAAMWTSLLGRELSPSEAATLPNFSKMRSAMEKARALQLVRGTGPTPEEYERLLGVGNTSSEGKTSRLSNLTVKALGGQATPDEMIELKVLAGSTFGAKIRRNAQGYDEWTADVNMPPEVEQALRLSSGMPAARTSAPGSFLPGQPISGIVPTAPSGPTERTVTLFNENNQPFAAGVMGPDGMFTAQAIPGAPQPPASTAGGVTGSWDEPVAQPVQQSPGGQKPLTVFQALQVTAGPINKLAGTARSVLGGMGPESGAVTLQNQPAVQNFVNRSVQLLSGPGRMLADERRDLIAEVGKINNTFTSPTGAEEIAYGIDVSMERMLVAAEAAANDKNLAAKDSNDARMLVGELKKLREEFGVVRPKNQRELKQAFLEGRLNIGQRFFMPDGSAEVFDQDAYNLLFGTKK